MEESEGGLVGGREWTLVKLGEERVVRGRVRKVDALGLLAVVVISGIFRQDREETYGDSMALFEHL